MFKKLTEKTDELISKHPRLISIAVGFAITLAVGTALGSVQVQQAHALEEVIWSLTPCC